MPRLIASRVCLCHKQRKKLRKRLRECKRDLEGMDGEGPPHSRQKETASNLEVQATLSSKTVGGYGTRLSVSLSDIRVKAHAKRAELQDSLENMKGSAFFFTREKRRTHKAETKQAGKDAEQATTEYTLLLALNGAKISEQERKIAVLEETTKQARRSSWQQEHQQVAVRQQVGKSRQ